MQYWGELCNLQVCHEEGYQDEKMLNILCGGRGVSMCWCGDVKQPLASGGTC